MKRARELLLDLYPHKEKKKKISSDQEDQLLEKGISIIGSV